MIMFLLQRDGRYIDEEYDQGLPEGPWLYIRPILALCVIGYWVYRHKTNKTKDYDIINLGVILLLLLGTYVSAIIDYLGWIFTALFWIGLIFYFWLTDDSPKKKLKE